MTDPRHHSFVYDLERYLNVRSAYGATFGPNGRNLLPDGHDGRPAGLDARFTRRLARTAHLLRRTGLLRFLLPRTTGAHLRDGRGRQRAATVLPARRRGQIHPLTDQPDAKHRWGGWSHDGERFAFAANRRDESVFDVYVQDRDAMADANGDDSDAAPTDAAELLFEGDGWLSVGGWSPPTIDCWSRRRTPTSTRTSTSSTSRPGNSTT